MQVTWFATFQNTDKPEVRVAEHEMRWLENIISTTPGMAKGMIYTPWPVDGLHYDDGPPPQLQLQLYFKSIEALEAVICKDGHLQSLSDSASLASLSAPHITEQAMLVRNFPVPERPRADAAFCSYVVHYPGPADDLNLWLRHYIDGHTPVMRRFPGIRGVEVSSRLDWCSALPWNRVNYMQRNKVVFDDAQALKAALASPIMQEMRADLEAFPPFAGGNMHFPMRTIQIDGT
jgi:uncharacterized protein (TIGR02118 family)